MMRKFFILTAIFLLCNSVGFLSAQYKKKEVTIKDRHFFVDLAKTPEEWRKGLMNRPQMAPHEGMFFVGDIDRVQSFWMKNTLISLDIIFIDNDMRIVHIAENAEPLSEKSLSSNQPARHVLEILGGLSSRYGFKPGDKVKIK